MITAIDKALALLQQAREYENAWLDHGADRVRLYIDDVDGDWLEKWGEDKDDS